jgi:Amidohydrolase family
MFLGSVTSQPPPLAVRPVTVTMTALQGAEVVEPGIALPGQPVDAGLHGVRREHTVEQPRFGGGSEVLHHQGVLPESVRRERQPPAATSTAAAAMRAGQIGSIEPGKAADLLVVKGDPLTDITAVRAVAMVYRAGRLVVDNAHPHLRGATAPSIPGSLWTAAQR